MANGQWPMALCYSSTVDGFVLSGQEFRDSIHLRCGIAPGDCCGQKSTVQHALAECKTGGNVISHHNEIRDMLVVMASKALIPSTVRNEPLIYTSCVAVKMSDLDQANALLPQLA
jgi:hypothetical protein